MDRGIDKKGKWEPIQGKWRSQLQSISCRTQKMVNMGSRITKFCCLISNYPSLTLRLLHTYMICSCVRATWLLQTKFQPLNCPQLDLRHWAALCWALSHISSLFLNYLLVGLWVNAWGDDALLAVLNCWQWTLMAICHMTCVKTLLLWTTSRPQWLSRVCFITPYSRGADRGYHAPLLGLNPMHILLYSRG